MKKKVTSFFLICTAAVSLLLAAFSLGYTLYRQPKTLFDLGIADIADNGIMSVSVVLDGGNTVIITDAASIEELQESLQGIVLIKCPKTYKVPGIRTEVAFRSADGKETRFSVLNNTFEYEGKLYKTNMNLNSFTLIAEAESD